MKNIILIILLSICFSSSEGKTLSLQGTVFGDDGSVIAGATMFARPCGIADSVAYGNASDGNGRYQLQLPTCDSLRLSVTYIGYERHEELLTNLAENAEHDIVLNRSTVELGEVTVERDNTVIKEDVLQFYLDRKQAQASSNATELLDRLMIPNINIDRSSWKKTHPHMGRCPILHKRRPLHHDRLLATRVRAPHLYPRLRPPNQAHRPAILRWPNQHPNDVGGFPP